jgi:drug/metabolite transporter (DMT)-like permease
LVFKDDLAVFDFSSEKSLGLILSFLSVIGASLGNIISAYNQRNKLPVVQTNAYGMLYGSLSMLILVFIIGTPISFDVSFKYISSLIYLAVFGSIIAFYSYLTLLGKIGADRAAYVTLVFPIIALLLSTFFEEYTWSLFALLGVVLITAGNFLVLKKAHEPAK